MTKKPHASKERTAEMHQTHVYIPIKDYRALELRAAAECRSISSQILVYVRKGLALNDLEKS